MSVTGLLDTRQFMPWPEGAVLVGGAVRDALLGRPTTDLDWLVADPAASARRHAELLGGSQFLMDEERRHWRVALPTRSTHDFVPLRTGARDLEQDLRLRDLTFNAMALTEEGRLVDPTGGRQDLSNKQVRMTSLACLTADAVRPLRVVRFAATLAFNVEHATKAATQAAFEAQRSGSAPMPTWERVSAELQATLTSSYAARGFALLKALGGLALYLPELELGRGVNQGALHHLDVLDHQLEALHQLLQGFPDAEPALRWATILHDVGKPACIGRTPMGTPTFYGHDKVGSEMVRALLQRLRLPNNVVSKATALVRYHMLPLPRGERAVRRFVHRRRELLPDLLKLMLADREAARGRAANERARVAYRTQVSAVLAELEAVPNIPLIMNGDEVMELLGLDPGPLVGEALALLSESQALGDVRDLGEAEALLLRYAAAQGWTGERASRLVTRKR